MRREWVAEAQRAARRQHKRFGIGEPDHIRVEAIAKYFGIAISIGKLDGADSQLIRSDARSEILISDRIKDPAAQRFCIAHELGHFVLDHPTTEIADLCRSHRPRRRSAVAPEHDYEAEANAFAAELLMPDAWLRRSCEISPVDLAVPRRIAERYGVSILASSIRFCELASECCAVVFAAHGAVVWFAPSTSFTIEIPRGQRIDPRSLAWDGFANGSIVDEPQPITACAWLDTPLDLDLIEHAIYSPPHRTTLSMLWAPDRVASRLGMIAI